MTIVIWVIYRLLNLVDLLLLVYCIMSWVPSLRGNQWMRMLQNFMDPVLNPLRKVIARYLPRQWQVVDLSPVAAWLILALIRQVLAFLLR